MAFSRFRPTSHFIAPHSWSNDPCGAVYIPETKQYIFCYQWNPGTTEGGNCAWGMARSNDLVTWEDCSPAIRNGITYDSMGVFSGSIASRLIEERRVLFLFYTSVSAVPIHWSIPYHEGCESQSVAISTDFGATWHRHSNNPLLSVPPKKGATTGWRDPFVSQWLSLSALLGMDPKTNFMMIASAGITAQSGSKILSNSELCFGKNFECASFFHLGEKDHLILGVEEDVNSERHSARYTLWLSGNLVLRNDRPLFEISGHGLVDHGISYAPHIFFDSEGLLLQLGWADEAGIKHVVKGQSWAGCLVHPRELFEISREITEVAKGSDAWSIDQTCGKMTTLGIRPAAQVSALRMEQNFSSLTSFDAIHSTNYEVEATFSGISGNERFSFNVRQSPDFEEYTEVIFDIRTSRIIVDRSRSSLDNLGTNTPDSGHFQLLPGEDLKLRFFVDESILEVYANDRFALTSRTYPSLETSVGASHDFEGYNEANVRFKCWQGLKNAWPGRKADGCVSADSYTLSESNDGNKATDTNGLLRQAIASA